MAVLPARQHPPAAESQGGPRIRLSLGWCAAAVGIVWALIPVGLLAYHTIRHGGVLSGSNGRWPAPTSSTTWTRCGRAARTC